MQAGGLLSAGDDGCVHEWDPTAEGGPAEVRQVAGHKLAVRALAVANSSHSCHLCGEGFGSRFSACRTHIKSVHGEEYECHKCSIISGSDDGMCCYFTRGEGVVQALCMSGTYIHGSSGSGYPQQRIAWRTCIRFVYAMIVSL